MLRLAGPPLAALVVLACSASCTHAQEPAPQKKDGVEEGAKTKHPPNRLSKEQSPYLRQHAHNPVDWYPWGEEAFAKARKENKLVFLSIGYATCHWCHVMERESFENEAVAKFLNEHYVAIKVDREERPDVDEVYMTAIQLATGGGGWPLSVWLTPDAKPLPHIEGFAKSWGSSLTGGTYFPQPARFGRRAFMDELRIRADLWKKEGKAIARDATTWAKQLKSALGRTTKVVKLTAASLERGYKLLSEAYDSKHGGFSGGGRTKFPMPHNMSFLFSFYGRTVRTKAADLAFKTLDAIAKGGLRDHLGGGFHRYSTDPEWKIPHFEKMLYDQAGLVRAYVEAYQLSREQRYADVARECVDFVLREMTTAEGAFTSAWDADSEGVEGKFYVWTQAEVKQLLGADAPLFMARYSVSEEGNFHDIPGHQSHLQLQDSLQTLAKRHTLSVEEVSKRLEAGRKILFAARAKRVPPLHDDKVLSDWNGLMIGAAAVAGRGLNEPRYTAAALKAATFVLENLRVEGKLRHRWRAGDAKVPAMLEDYAFLAWGFLELFESTQDPRWILEARTLCQTMIKECWDPQAGGFFQVAAGTKLLARPKPTYDGAIPSGNSAAALVLLRLSTYTGEQTFYEHGRRTLDSYSSALAHSGGRTATLGLQAVDWLIGPRRELVIAGDPKDALTQSLLAEARKRYLPRCVVILRPPGEPKLLLKAVTWVKAQPPIDGKPTAYLCTDFSCQAPVFTTQDLIKLLGK